MLGFSYEGQSLRASCAVRPLNFHMLHGRHGQQQLADSWANRCVELNRGTARAMTGALTAGSPEGCMLSPSPSSKVSLWCLACCLHETVEGCSCARCAHRLSVSMGIANSVMHAIICPSDAHQQPPPR